MNSQEYRDLSEAYLDVYQEEVLDEGIGSAIRGLFGKKKEPEAPAPQSRGAELRAKYNTGPEKTETSVKRKILDKTRERAERDEKEYGDSTYSKSVATKSREAHDKYLRAGYNKYGADRPDSGGMGGSGGSGRGSKAAKRAAALNNSYEPDLFDVILEYLIDEGYADTNENALVIMANMSEDWRESIVEVTGRGRIDPIGDASVYGAGVGERNSRTPKDAGLRMSPVDRATARANALKKRNDPEATKRANRINSRFVNPTNRTLDRSMLAANNQKQATAKRLRQQQQQDQAQG